MLKLQEELKSGNLSVRNSKRFGKFDDYFLPQEQWASRREAFFQRSGLHVGGLDIAVNELPDTHKEYRKYAL